MVAGDLGKDFRVFVLSCFRAHALGCPMRPLPLTYLVRIYADRADGTAADAQMAQMVLIPDDP
jgi:hypothetical protein